MAKSETIREKLVVVGDKQCGKTCLLTMFRTGEFPIYMPAHSECYIPDITVDGRTVQLALWDTAAQENYDRLRPLYYADSNVVVICFAIDDPVSLRNVEEKWYPELAQYIHHVPRILVGCKKDIRDDPVRIEELRRAGHVPVTTVEGMVVVKRIEAKQYFECSAKYNDGVREVFEAATRAALDKRKSRGQLKREREAALRRERYGTSCVIV